MEDKIIEQVFKEAFKEYTPDVSPKVWSEISQQIVQPVTPTVQAPGSLAKIAAAKLSSASTWIIGGIAATAITTGIFIYEHKNAPDNNNDKAIQTSASVAARKIDETEPLNKLSVIEKPANQQEKSKDPEKTKSNLEPVVEKGTNEQSNVSVQQNNETTNGKQVITSASNESITDDNHKDNQNSTNDPQIPVNSLLNNAVSTDKAVPLILINTTAGLAPLQIAGLLNKEGVTGDWEFGDGSSQLESNTATHKYTKPGTYLLQCKSGETVLTKTIEVIGEISTVFSPNGDGINDYFLVNATNLKTLSLRIFDRNGRKMAELKSPEEKWDGHQISGGIAEKGTYFYELNATTENGMEIKQRGAINLFR